MADIQRFFVDAIGGALEHGLAVPDDVLKHVTPDVLAAHLPRSLWAKLLGACLAAPRVDSRLVVDTIGIVDLCANVPGGILWNIVQDVAMRALGRGLVSAPPPALAGDGARRPDKAAERSAEKVAKAPDKADKAAEKAEKLADKAGEKVADKAAEKAEKVADRAPAKAAEKLADKAPEKADKAAEKVADRPPDKVVDRPSDRMAVPMPVPVMRSGPLPVRTGSGPVMAAPFKAPNVVASTPPADNRPPTATATATATQAPAAPPPGAAVDIYFDDDEDEPAPLDAPPLSPHRAPTVIPGQEPRNGTRAPTGAGASSRRPQARTSPRTTPPSTRRGVPADFDLDTDVGIEDKDVPVDDDQLVDWSSSEETVISGVEVDRKR